MLAIRRNTKRKTFWVRWRLYMHWRRFLPMYGSRRLYTINYRRSNILAWELRGKATKQLSNIANSRQVIVFTHRISLLVGMSEACAAGNVPIKELHIRSTLSGKGLPDFEDVYHGNVKGQLGGLKDKLSRAKKMDADSAEYNDCIGRVCQHSEYVLNAP